MKHQAALKTMVVISIFAVIMILAGAGNVFAEYTFKVHNTTDTKITKIEVSEDGKEWGFFDIGSGIPAGETVELVWDSSTDSEDCSQYFRAYFDDNTVSEAAKFDFCEKGLTLEF